LYINNTAINTSRALRYVIERAYQNAIEEIDRASTQYDFRQYVSKFQLPQSAIDKNLTVVGDLTSCLDIKEAGVRLENSGEGKISICKTDSALDKRVDGVSILALEEPENHLSHYNLRHLISMVKERAETRQMFIVTHNSYITSRLGLRNAFFVNKGKVLSLVGLSDDTGAFFMKAPNDNLLQFVLSQKVLLVEGAAEFILMDQFFTEVTGHNASTHGIWIMALNNLSFRRYLEVGKLLNIQVAAVRDNDGAPKKWYEDLQSERRKVFSDPSKERKTFEVCLYQDNKDVLDSIFPNQESVLDYMLAHKAEAAYQILKSEKQLAVPKYIKEAIEWLI
jgi:predicted ATP-dependent endonuclease of OLD family